ncbi:MAG: site-specific integrase [Cyanomargarita calcarea GSE-NOS-MK-12-04C]|jgi:hypothetical protein|uniref:Site-specific integrase n=1 Tax=Cyanomargarita calcarea GSE-NOS-MK-12-04C TaxID=2839659 RepID=A0A951QIY3_9CYAN|nr:site-specific integrase [Cyanomargarita calcarea GSE-NOS-MK-12-04C]
MESQNENRKSNNFFADFNPPSTTDGSYMGKMKKVQATENYLKSKFDEEFKSTNERLKAASIKVSLKLSGKTIQLQATLPDKPSGTKGKPWQQKISLGIPANLDGLKTAEEEAYELGRLLARKQFEWNEKYLGRKEEKEKIITFQEIYERFEEAYFQTRKKAETSKHTCYCYMDYFRRLIPLNENVTASIVKDIIDKQATESNKAAVSKTLRVAFKMFDIDIEVKAVAPPKAKERKIPTDEEIISSWGMYEIYSNSRPQTCAKKYWDNWMMWQWVYGMLATYGLRPRELFMCPDLDWWLSSKNTHHTWKVHEDTKTGRREVIPFVPEWIELFDLKAVKPIELLRNYINERKDFWSVTMIRQNCSSWFRRVSIQFDPYDLRHACAIRGHMQGIPPKAAADNLGHTTEVHLEIYQKWFGLDNRKKAFKDSFGNLSEIENLKLEIQQLKLENEYLKLELHRSRLESVPVR